MDVNDIARNGHGWTNDKHLRFLKSVEASFVRTLMVNGDGRRILPMDRDVPDSCESTLDTKEMTSAKRRKSHFSTDNLETSISIDRRVKRLRFHPSPLDDQVVPQIKHLKTEDDDQNWTSST